MKFKVGDRVRVVKVNLKYFTPKKIMIGKEFRIDKISKAIDGTTCYASNSNMFNWFEGEIELAKQQNTEIRIFVDGDKVIAKNTATNKVGIARCNPEDTFDFSIGAKLAFDRLMGVEEKKLIDEVNEVKRKAKVGEYIKIIDAFMAGDCYKNGDILKVSSVDESGVVVRTIGGVKEGGVYHREYVVLENYNPSLEEPKNEEKKSNHCEKPHDRDMDRMMEYLLGAALLHALLSGKGDK